MSLSGLFRGRAVILLDFDGPVCAAFGATGGRPVADLLLSSLRSRGFRNIVSDVIYDPLEVLRIVAREQPTLAAAADHELRRLEFEAIPSAEPTPGAISFLRSARSTGRKVAIVSNNSADAVQAYLAAHQLSDLVAATQGREPGLPSKMKPSPWPLESALQRLGRTADDAIMIGDSPADVQAASAIRVPCIGFANKPGKEQRLLAAGAVAVSHSMSSLSLDLLLSP